MEKEAGKSSGGSYWTAANNSSVEYRVKKDNPDSALATVLLDPLTYLIVGPNSSIFNLQQRTLEEVKFENDTFL
jgi:hypothetical protein